MDDGSIYSDVDSEGFLEDMRNYGVGQALPLDVSAQTPEPCHPIAKFVVRSIDMSAIHDAAAWTVLLRCQLPSLARTFFTAVHALPDAFRTSAVALSNA